MKNFNYHINLKGVNIDRLLLNLNSKNIKLKNLKRKSHTELDFFISKSDYLSIEKYLKDFDIQIVDVGVKKIKAVAWSLIAVWLSIPIMVLCAFVCSNYIWKIEVNGLNKISRQQLNEILLEENVKVGSKKNLSVDKLEKALLSHGEFAQVSCYYRGTTLFINLSEKLVFSPPEYEPIRANYNGIILDYTLKKGTINFIKGEFVKEGDILVYPYIYDKHGNKIKVEPDCEIKAKIYLNSTKTLHQKEIILSPSGKVKKHTNILFNNKKFSYKKVQPFVFYEIKVYNKYISSVLPFIKQTVLYYELVEKEKVNDLIALTPELELESKTECESLIKDEFEMISSSTNSQIIDNILFATTTIVCIGNIIGEKC